MRHLEIQPPACRSSAIAMVNTHSGNGAFGSTRFLNEIDFERHVDTVHFNPVEHKLAGRARDWPYSSFHAYVRHGLKPADWAGDVEEPMMDFGERRGVTPDWRGVHPRAHRRCDPGAPSGLLAPGNQFRDVP
jgi:hypothetical protein